MWKKAVSLVAGCSLLAMLIASGCGPKQEAAKVIKIGIIGPMQFVQGEHHWYGATMAADEINAAGGISVGKEQYTKGHFTGIGMAIGILIGMPMGLALGNIALGPAIGVPIGLGIGAVLEKRYNKYPRELTRQEKARQKRASWIGIAVGTAFLIAGVLVYLSVK